MADSLTLSWEPCAAVFQALQRLAGVGDAGSTGAGGRKAGTESAERGERGAGGMEDGLVAGSIGCLDDDADHLAELGKVELARVVAIGTADHNAVKSHRKPHIPPPADPNRPQRL